MEEKPKEVQMAEELRAIGKKYNLNHSVFLAEDSGKFFCFPFETTHGFLSYCAIYIMNQIMKICNSTIKETKFGEPE